ncbi:lactosylceramide 4-alpha-galactosyltransferase [Eupeodes corollae]|uniref:lactosylceramide 4-alpha-galactosyltransferase n=1 Tax=Eupeodes corollae TaxID=290404 RepID=UPI0024903BC6|nr:lactosylceramide 4-alpha-galactosyltransferase [Eupeodes corollae]
MILSTINKCFHKIQQYRYRFIFCILITTSLLSLLLNNLKKHDEVRSCFTHSNKRTELSKLEDILLSNRKPQPGKSIFFHETSCSSSSINMLSLSARQACAIESAALSNPNYDVFVLFASPTFFNNGSSQPILESILSYPNVYIRNLNLWTYASNTPIYDWLLNDELFSSKYVLSHISDFLRYLTLWRWGGTYLDLDVIVKKSLENIPSNYAGAESDTFIAAGVMNFDATGFGHEIAELCLRDFQLQFNGNDWGNNGPGVITRVLNKVCKTK